MSRLGWVGLGWVGLALDEVMQRGLVEFSEEVLGRGNER